MNLPRAIAGLYHKVFGLPHGAEAPWLGTLRLRYSDHARLASVEDRYGRIPLFEAIEVEPGDVVEVEVEEGRAVKAIVRIPFDDRRDLVYAVLRPEAGVALVKTVWFNQVNDPHKTLKRFLYRHGGAQFAVN